MITQVFAGQTSLDMKEANLTESMSENVKISRTDRQTHLRDASRIKNAADDLVNFEINVRYSVSYFYLTSLKRNYTDR